MSKKKTTKKTAAKSSSSDKLKRAAIAEIGDRIKRIDGDGDSPAPKPAPAKDAKPKRTSCINAAYEVLVKAGRPMRPAEMLEASEWTSPGGKTPEATLYAAIIREINAKGDKARFRRADAKGTFVAA